MAIQLAWYDLIHRRSRTFAALGGVVFAIVLIFMQLGFYLACRTSATRIHTLLDSDIFITSARYAFVAEADRFPRERIEQARAVQGVASVAGVRVGPSLWRTPQTRNRYDTVFLSVDPMDRPFVPGSINAQLDRLQRPDTVLFDQLAHPVLGDTATGTVSETESRRLTVVGEFSWGVGFVANGIAITSESTFSNLFPNLAADELQLGLLRLRPGARIAEVRDAVRQRLPSDVKIWSRQDIEDRDRRFFLSERPIGLMFQSGVVLAVLVGGIILFQVLASEVTSRRTELATLQAMGYSRGQVYRMVVVQGLLYTLAAFLPAVLLSSILFGVVRQLARLPMELSVGLLLAVLLISVAMCLAGALLASRRVRTADPADLF